MKITIHYQLIVAALLATNMTLAATPSPAGANLYIMAPANGEVVGQSVTVKFGLSGMGVAPAGVDMPNTGHHHLLIDAKKLPAFDKPLPADTNHVHFGGGQTQATISLSPGKHTLQLLLADKNHVPHQPPILSEKITIVVK